MKIKYHIKQIKYLWKDNKIVLLKHIYNIFICGINKIPSYLKRKAKDKEVNNIIGGRLEIIKEINYDLDKKSKIILPIEDKGLTRDLVLNGIREPNEVKLFIKEVKDGMNVIDIGSNLGFYLLLEPHLTKGKIYGIEPNSNSFKYLKRSVELNKFKNIKLFNMGISFKRDVIPFYISRNWNWSRFTKSGEDIIETKEIQVNSLDNMFKDNKIDIIRMDVEGYEIKILKGAEDLIKNNPNIIIFLEYHANMFNTKERIEFIKWLEKNKLKIKYLFNSEKIKSFKIKEDFNLNKLKNLNSDYCIVLKRRKNGK